MKRTLSILVVTAMLCLLFAGMAPAASYTWTHDLNADVTASDYPDGVAFDKAGVCYMVTSDSDYVYRYDPDGTPLGTWGLGTGTGNGQLDGPFDVEVDRWGNVFVAERTNARVTVFNAAGAFSRHISQSGADPDDLFSPVGLAVSLDGFVYVSDNLLYLKKFDSYGSFQGRWTTDGPARGVTCDQDGDVWVANDQASGARPLYGNTVIRYSPQFAMLDSWGSTGTASGEFSRPYDVDVDGQGTVFVADTGNNRMQVFEHDGTYIDEFGTGGAGDDEFSTPYGIGVSKDRRAAVADTFHHRTSLWSALPPQPTDTRSVAGATRYQTAVQASQLAYPDGCGTVVVATGTNWPDALGGASLAGVLDAPLLLTTPSALSADVTAEISRLGVAEAYVLGGEGAVSAAVFDSLEGILGVGNVRRLGGADRYATANLIAAETVTLLGTRWDGTAFVATGRAFPDALAVSPISAANHWPIYLSAPDSLGAAKAAMQAAGVTHGYLVGGTGALSDAVETDLNSTFIGFTRYGGADRYDTAANIATAGFSGMGMLWSRPAIATGQDFPDALAGGVLQGSDYSVMLLTPRDSLHPSTAAALDAYEDHIYEMRFLGGTGAVSQPVRDAAMARLH